MKINTLYTIKSKFAYNVAFIVIFMLLLLIISLFFIENTIKNSAIIHELSTLNNNSINLETNLEEYVNSNHVSSFYEMGEDKYTQQVTLQLKKIAQSLSIFETEENLQDTEMAAFLQQAKQQIEQFNNNFTILNLNVVKIGNSEYGYFSESQFSALTTQEKITAFGNLTAKVMLKKIESQEKRFLANTQTKNLKEFSDLCNELINYMRFLGAEGTINNYGNRQIIDATAKYMHDFERFGRALLKNGLQKKEGIYGRLINLNIEFKSTLTELTQEVHLRSLKQNKQNKIYFIITGSIFIFIILIIQYFFAREITSEINILTNSSKIITLESAEKVSQIKGKDEFATISNNLFIIQQKLLEEQKYLQTLSEDLYASKLPVLTFEGKTNKILTALHEAISKLHESQKKEALQKQIRDKNVNGLAEFGDILRKNAGDLESLTLQIISKLVAFLGANIGGFYITESIDNDTVIKLKASYAYNKKKIIYKEIKPGEGLIGTCALEKTTFYFDNLPNDYLKIYSGFGSIVPNALIIVPITYKKRVFGILELATLSKFTASDISFIEMLSEDIGSTLSYMTESLVTKQLLSEMSNKVAQLESKLQNKV